MTLGLTLGVLSRPLLAQDAEPAAAADPPALEPASPAPGQVLPPAAEPVMDLPTTPAPSIESITLFPHQGELTSGNSFNDQRFGYVLHGQVRASYDSNIFIKEHGAEHDFIFTIQPGLAVGWGEFKSELYGPDSFRHRFERYVEKNYIFADYSPSYTWFASHGSEDTFDHDAKLEGEWTIRRLTFGVRARYVTENVAEADIGERIEERHPSAALTSRYQYSGKTSFEVNGFYQGTDYAGNNVDTKEWRNEDWLNYQISPKIKLGLGGAFAYIDRSSEPSQTYQQGLARVKYEATAKFTVSLTAGGDWRQTENAGSRTDGVFQLDLAWTPFAGSYLYLQGYRRAYNSGIEGSEYFQATGISLEYRQRLFQRFYFDLTGGYQNADYKDELGSPNFGRNDDLYFIRPSIGFDLAQWLNCEISGEYQKNDSNSVGHSFDTTIVMLKFNLLF
ncbi:MAG: hypothetical protein ABJF10_03985 [Chthoniobacter sp.]